LNWPIARRGNEAPVAAQELGIEFKPEALLAATLLARFIRCERDADAPLIDLGRFRRCAFALDSIAGGG